jgi:hypothetical protein
MFPGKENVLWLQMCLSSFLRVTEEYVLPGSQSLLHKCSFHCSLKKAVSVEIIPERMLVHVLGI